MKKKILHQGIILLLTIPLISALTGLGMIFSYFVGGFSIFISLMAGLYVSGLMSIVLFILMFVPRKVKKEQVK